MRKLLTLVLVLGLVAVSCGEDSAEETSTTSSEAAGTTTSAASDPTTTEAPEEATTTVGQSGEGGPDCLVGTWILDSEAFIENFDSIFAEAGMPGTEVTALDGTFTVDLGSDGSLSATRDGWGFNIVTDEEAAIVIEINGTETGTWSADDSTLRVSTDTSDIEVSTSIQVDGEVLEMPDGQAPVDVPSGIASGSDYTCSGDVLTLTNAGVESVLNRA